MKLIPGISEPYSSQILELFAKLPVKSEVVLFGSRSKGNFREGSDIDLAFKGMTEGLDWRDRVLSRYEELNLPWKLDIVVYSHITEPALKEHIDRVGKIIFPRSP